MTRRRMRRQVAFTPVYRVGPHHPAFKTLCHEYAIAVSETLADLARGHRRTGSDRVVIRSRLAKAAEEIPTPLPFHYREDVRRRVAEEFFESLRWPSIVEVPPTRPGVPPVYEAPV